MAKYLKDLMHEHKLEEKFKDNKINLIVSPVGSGKTTYIMDFIKRKGYSTFGDHDSNIVYVVDTTNLKQSISLLYGDQLMKKSNLSYDEVFHTLENGSVLIKNGMSIMTYNALNSRLEKGQINIGDIFIFDEFHSLFKYLKAEFSDQYRYLADNLETIFKLNQVIALTATPQDVYDYFEFNFKDEVINDIIPCELTKELNQYGSKYTIKYNDIKSTLSKLHFNKALIYYAGGIDKLKLLYEDLSQQYNVDYIISQRKCNDQKMIDLANHIISTGLFPDDLDVLIINSTFESGINIKDERVDTYLSYTYLADFIDETSITQSRGRIRHNIKYHCEWQPKRKVSKNDKKDVDSIDQAQQRIELLNQMLDVELDSDSFKRLAEKLNFRKNRKLIKNPIKEIENLGYVISNKRIENKRYKIINGK